MLRMKEMPKSAEISHEYPWKAFGGHKKPDLLGPFAWRSRMGVFMVTSNEKNDNVQYAWLKSENGIDGRVIVIDKNNQQAIAVAESVSQGGELITRPDGFSGQFVVKKLKSRKSIRELTKIDLEPDKLVQE